jgi:hypothetical protein
VAARHALLWTSASCGGSVQDFWVVSGCGKGGALSFVFWSLSLSLFYFPFSHPPFPSPSHQEIPNAAPALHHTPAIDRSQPSALEVTPSVDPKWNNLTKLVTAMALDCGEVGILQLLQNHPNWGPKQWKRAAEKLGVSKKSYRKLARRMAIVDGARASTFLELCTDFQAPNLSKVPGDRRECTRLKHAFVLFGQAPSRKVCDLLNIPVWESSVHHIGDSTVMEYLLRQKNQEDRGALPVDGEGDYSDEDFAIMRHVLTEGGMSMRKFGAVFAGFYYFLISRRTLKARFMRLAHKDSMNIRAEVLSMAAAADSYTIGCMTDCSFYGEERMVS